MKIGIIVHSHTGNTLLIAQKLMDTFSAEGHYVNIERVEAFNEEPSKNGNIQLIKIPEIGEYDIIIFGAPVRAFSLSPIMMEYLKQIETMQGKKVGCFVTQFFPFAWMGGNKAISQIRKTCESKGAKMLSFGIVNWSNVNRRKKINHVINKLSNLNGNANLSYK